MQRFTRFDTSLIMRIAKIALLFFFGTYAALVAFGNVVDPQSNLVFIEHVLSMDTTFKKPELMWRAISNPALYTVSLWMITLLETLICICCFGGMWRLIKVLGGDSESFHAAKGLGILGLVLGLSLWFFGFQVIGAEWFASWQSQVWHGFEPAGRIMNFLLGSLIFMSLKND